MLSGAPLKGKSQACITDMYRLTGGKLPIIGCGGIASGADAYARIRAGASLVQIYTALIYEGPTLVHDILRGLADRLDRVFLHPWAGPAILLAVLFVMFQTVFSWAQPVMDALQAAMVAAAIFMPVHCGNSATCSRAASRPTRSSSLRMPASRSASGWPGRAGEPISR